MVNGAHPLVGAVDRLAERRRAIGLSQLALEDRAGFPQGRVAHWESGRCHPSVASLIIWAEALGCRLVLGGSPVPDARSANSEYAFLAFLQTRNIQVHAST